MLLTSLEKGLTSVEGALLQQRRDSQCVFIATAPYPYSWNDLHQKHSHEKVPFADGMYRSGLKKLLKSLSLMAPYSDTRGFDIPPPVGGEYSPFGSLHWGVSDTFL